jgi:hypothetical protein
MSENLPSCVTKDMGPLGGQCLTGPAITPFLLAAEATCGPRPCRFPDRR